MVWKITLVLLLFLFNEKFYKKKSGETDEYQQNANYKQVFFFGQVTKKKFEL